MTIKLKNNAVSYLASAVGSSDVVITVTDGSVFPQLTTNEYFLATVVGTGGATEIMKCTARSGNVLSVVRGQENTPAGAFSQGSRIELRITAQSVYDVINDGVESMAEVVSDIQAVITTADNIANVNTVAGISTNVTTVAGISANVTTVATNIADVNTVAADLNEPVSEIGTVAGSITNVDAVGSSITNVIAVSGQLTDIATVAPHVNNIDTVAPSIGSVNTVATDIANVNIAAANIASINSAATNAQTAVDAAATATTANNNAQSAASTATTAAANALTYKDAAEAAAVGASNGVLGKQTKALLDADLAHAEGRIAYVTNDSTAANNGYYIKIGASGTGSWTQSSYDRVAALENEFDIQSNVLDSLGLSKFANLFPNGGFVPNATTGVFFDQSLAFNGGGGYVHTPITQTELNNIGLNYALRVGTNDTNRHVIMQLPQGIGGWWVIGSYYTYAPSGLATDHGFDSIYIGKNGALGDGTNGATNVVRTHIEITPYVWLHHIKFKLFTDYTSAQLWLGSTGISGTGYVYLTGYNATWSEAAGMTLQDTKYDDFATGSFLQDQIYEAQQDILGLQAVKKDKEVPGLTEVVNAVTDRYATRTTSPDKHKPQDADTTVSYPYVATAYSLVGDPNTIKGLSQAAGRYTPAVTVRITPEDLAAIGVVPNDTTPPRVSFRAGLLDQGLNQTYTAQQIFFLLQYSDGPLNNTYGSGQDVLFNTGSATAEYLGNGDAFWTHTVVTDSVSSSHRIYCHNNVPIPATYNGKPFRGIKMLALGYQTDTTTPMTKEIFSFAHALVNATSIDPRTPFLNKPDDIVGYVALSDIQRIDAEMAQKVPGYDNVSYENAVKNMFGPENATASDNIGGRGSITYYRAPEVFDKYGARNVLKGSFTGTSVRYYPMITVKVSLDDLADMGMVPSDSSPPLISMKAAWVKSLLTTQNQNSLQIFFSLRYGSVLDNEYRPANDVMFNTALNYATWLGTGDTTWNHTVTAYDDGVLKGYLHSGIPLRASYNGLPLVGIVINALGWPTTEGVSTTSIIGLSDVAVRPGTSMTPYTLYLNSPDDYPKVGNIQKNQFSQELQDQLVFKGEGGDVANTITIKNSDKITLLGDSYTASHYTMKDKPYIARMSELSDWRFENFARSGDDYAEINQRILTNVGEYHPTISFKEYGSTYALLISFTNDTWYRSRDRDYFFDNVRRIAQTVMSCGVKPILATEFVTGNSRELTGLSAIAQELGIEYIDIASNARLFDKTRFDQFWGGGHPAARTNGLFTDPLLAQLRMLPRPKQAIKIYRRRPTYTVATDSDLLYDNIQQRVKRWKEITLGHHSLVGRLEPYYDRMTDIATAHGGYSYNNNTSEYLKLQNNESVNFADYALVEVILPTTAARASSVTLNLDNTTVQVFTRNAITTTSWSAYNKRQAFVVSTFPTLTAGDTYSYNGTTYTYVGSTTTPSGDKIVIFSPHTTTNSSTPGTLSRVSGSGDLTIAFSRMYTGYDVAYYADLYKPRGQWAAQTNANGKVTLSGAALQQAMQYDKVIFMLKAGGGFSLSDISVDWYGIEGKDMADQSLVLPKGGTQLLTSTKFDTVGSWTLEGTAAAGDPIDGVLPATCTKLMRVSTTGQITQSFSYTADSRYWKELDIVVWARWFPAMFIPSADEATALTQYNTSAPINSNTADYRTLKVQLDNGSSEDAVKIEELIGLHWKEVRLRVQIPNIDLAGSSFNLRLTSTDGEIEIALAEVYQING